MGGDQRWGLAGIISDRKTHGVAKLETSLAITLTNSNRNRNPISSAQTSPIEQKPRLPTHSIPRLRATPILEAKFPRSIPTTDCVVCSCCRFRYGWREKGGRVSRSTCADEVIKDQAVEGRKRERQKKTGYMESAIHFVMYRHEDLEDSP